MESLGNPLAAPISPKPWGLSGTSYLSLLLLRTQALGLSACLPHVDPLPSSSEDLSLHPSTL